MPPRFRARFATPVGSLRAKTSAAAANNGVKAMESTEVVTFELKEFPHWEPRNR